MRGSRMPLLLRFIHVLANLFWHELSSDAPGSMHGRPSERQFWVLPALHVFFTYYCRPLRFRVRLSPLGYSPVAYVGSGLLGCMPLHLGT